MFIQICIVLRTSFVYLKTKSLIQR